MQAKRTNELCILFSHCAGNRGCTEVLARGCRASVNMRDVFGETFLINDSLNNETQEIYNMQRHILLSLETILNVCFL